ncbi:MAG: hypothetical protein U0798_15340 [Gemmataceae bacterium]
MELWRKAWRDGFAKVISTNGLMSLASALTADHPGLVQGATTCPAPLAANLNHPIEGCCAIGFCGWQGDDLTTVGDVDDYFVMTCFDADQRLGETAACRFFLDWFDDSPRDVIRRELLVEVNREIEHRRETEAQPAKEQRPVDLDTLVSAAEHCKTTGQPYVALGPEIVLELVERVKRGEGGKS